MSGKRVIAVKEAVHAQPKHTAPSLRTPTESVVTYIAMRPVQSVEQIKNSLGVATKDSQIPIVRMVSAKKIKTIGGKDGTKYFAK